VTRILNLSVSIALFIAVVLATPFQVAGQAPEGFGKADHVIKVGTLVGRLRFDKETFKVNPGAKVKLTLSNNDAMQHNLLILRPGKDIATKIGIMAMSLGAKASDMQFVPKSPDVLFHTKAILPGQTDTIWFHAPKKPGAYPYICTLPGHMFTMRGVMHVGDVPAAAASVLPLREARYQYYEGSWNKLPDFSKLKPARSGKCKSGLFDLSEFPRSNNLGVVFTGNLHVKEKGKFRFFLNSDDGSQLFVNNKPVAIYDGLHGMAEEHKADVELSPGPNSVRVEFFQRTGGLGLLVGCKGPRLPRFSFTAKAKPRVSKGIPISVMDKPVVMRVHLEQGGGRSIAVGLPGGMNFCFDADQCSVKFGWAGAFLDVGPDRLGRGGQPCKILGHRFSVGDIGFPLRALGGKALPVQFKGYRLHRSPQFDLEWGGLAVACTISRATHGIGLQYTYKIPKAAAAIEFAVEPKGLKLTSSAGTWKGGVLTIPQNKAQEFQVTVMQDHGH
jgi:azurin